jgi:acetyl esterase/lipase
VRHVEAYGDHPLQVGEWFVPDATGARPAVVLIHGGFWRERYDRSLEEPVALDLASHGYLVWNVDYRSSATVYPTTLTDVAAAYDHIATSSMRDGIDVDRIAVVGHSAGGHLAAWLAGRSTLSPGRPGHSDDLVRPALVVPQAGVVALTAAARLGLGKDAPQALVDGSPDDLPDRYAAADPTRLLPTGVRSVLIHGVDDDIVPISQSETYVDLATHAGDDSTLVAVAGEHFGHIDPENGAVEALRAALASMSG